MWCALEDIIAHQRGRDWAHALHPWQPYSSSVWLEGGRMRFSSNESTSP